MFHKRFEYHKNNKKERLNLLAGEIFTTYFQSFEEFYAYSLFTEVIKLKKILLSKIIKIFFIIK
jgi:hypothetical protein